MRVPSVAAVHLKAVTLRSRRSVRRRWAYQGRSGPGVPVTFTLELGMTIRQKVDYKILFGTTNQRPYRIGAPELWIGLNSHQVFIFNLPTRHRATGPYTYGACWQISEPKIVGVFS